MCLKYFIGYTTCEHNEYLGSCDCSDIPCDLDKQQFYYMYDNFPTHLPLESSASDSVLSDTGAFACSTCAAEHSVQLDPDEVPVQYYAPTNDSHIEAVGLEDENRDYDFDFDYKSLSAADEEEWGAMDEQIHGVFGPSMSCHVQQQRVFEQERIARQRSNLPDYLAQQWQHWSFVLPGPSPVGYAMGSYAYYPKPHTGYMAAPPVQPVPQWRGDVTVPSNAALLPRPNNPPSPPMPSPTVDDAAKPTAPAPCPTGPRRPPTPPYIVGGMTDAYLRIEAARRRQMRERARRAASSRLRNALPAKERSAG
ncbi:hypothetical protein EKO04_004629 [Ascochyta lentis]|uniref:Uncharacterized protein n=1 Tax=Ascochyta lentis TaxID=205686 RepID=A0A8H7J5N9_9PLEO|nr:hypothetical protein EKO04_004629 [Ascochyta lentis]